MEPTDTPIPTLGRIVLYKLNDSDVANIRHKRPKDGPYMGNDVSEGQVVPAVVVAVWGQTPLSAVNLKLLLDGYDSGWVTSRIGSAGEHAVGTYAWPTRA